MLSGGDRDYSGRGRGTEGGDRSGPPRPSARSELLWTVTTSFGGQPVVKSGACGAVAGEHAALIVAEEEIVAKAGWWESHKKSSLTPRLLKTST